MYMQNHPTTASRSARNPILSSLSNGRRRRTLRILDDIAGPFSEEELATRIVAEEQETPLEDVTVQAVRSTQVSLRHVHLPTLERVGVVHWDREAATVERADLPVFQNPQFQTIVQTQTDGWSSVIDAIAVRRRRVVLSVLRERGGAMSLDQLAQAVYEQELDAGVTPEPADSDTVCHSLFHVHLPKLDDTGLVDYDADALQVAFEGHAALADSWLRLGPGEPPRIIA